MSTLEERLEYDQKLEFIFEKAAGEDQDALDYLKFLAYCARIADDVCDEFETLTQNNILCLIEILALRIPSNKFYIKHRDLLFSQHISMWNAWEASNILESGDETDKIYAHVLRDYINEILPVVALLTQGHDKMKEINGIMRFLFKKKLGE